MSVSSIASRSIVDLLKDLSAVVGILYIWGYITHVGYYRVLGVDVSGQPLDYLRLGGDLCTSLFITTLQLTKLGLYKHRLSEAVPLIGLLSIILLLAGMTIIAVMNLLSRKRRGRRYRNTKWLWPLRIITTAFVVLSFYSVLSLELDMAKVKDVLQPRMENDIRQMQAQVIAARAGQEKSRYTQQAMGGMVRQLYEAYPGSKPDTPGLDNWELWFYPGPDHKPNAERNASYLTLLLLNILVFATGIILILKLRKTGRLANLRPKNNARFNWLMIWRRGIAILIAAGLLIQALLLPLVYATLGRTFIYPLVSIKLQQEPDNSKKEVSNTPSSGNVVVAQLAQGKPDVLDPSVTHCVYLLAENENEIIVYDRLNFFQIKRITRSQVLRINQLSNLSPFESCSGRMVEFIPCEVQWMPESKPVLDF